MKRKKQPVMHVDLGLKYQEENQRLKEQNEELLKQIRNLELQLGQSRANAGWLLETLTLNHKMNLEINNRT